ncbi:uncharacterized protein LOC117303720 [Asterias rubens]|uniref:uncharacterized protein LOC117303720 n=1 Tax=Asterias rubens TaxID=7604 RepID=UPI001455BD42|nr:uncharacterized protein LOC117303720 [Asterias rubens]
MLIVILVGGTDIIIKISSSISSAHPTCIQNVQRTSAHVIVKRKKYDSITSELTALHWLPIQQRIKFKVLLLVYKALHKHLPSYISDLLCNHNADSLDHPHLLISLLCPEPMLCHLQIAHSPVLDQRNGTVSLTTSRMLLNTILVFKKLLKSLLFQQVYQH